MCSLFLSFRYSAWVVFNADGSLEIYVKKIKESQQIFVHTIIISEKSPVLFGYFVPVNVLARMGACTILWKNQCSLNFGKFMKKSDPIRICGNDPPQYQAENDPAETTHGRKPMFNECATSAFQRQGSDRYIGHWSLQPGRATEPIEASLILNIAISEPLLIT